MDPRIKYLIKEIFKKAKEESGQTSVYACCKHLENRFREDFKCHEGTSSRSFARLHQKYVEESQRENSTPKPGLLDAMSQYLGYSDYRSFLLEDKPISFNGFINRLTKISVSERTLIGILILIICLMLSYTIFMNNPSGPPPPECMIWKITHFEIISCELSFNIDKAGEIIGFDEKLYENMKMIPKSEVRVGSSYYYKVDRDSLQFFSWYGLHPVNGEDLKPVTNYIMDNYIGNQ